MVPRFRLVSNWTFTSLGGKSTAMISMSSPDVPDKFIFVCQKAIVAAVTPCHIDDQAAGLKATPTLKTECTLIYFACSSNWVFIIFSLSCCCTAIYRHDMACHHAGTRRGQVHKCTDKILRFCSSPNGDPGHEYLIKFFII